MATKQAVESARQPKAAYHPELDGLRALAALMVLVFHLAQAGIHVPGPVTFGQTGVDLFFILSGFLITSILLRSRPGDWSEVKTFYIRRSLRIFPLYFGYLILSTLIVGRAPSWQYWVYLQNFANAFHMPLTGPSHFWSLAVEEQFYLFWPFLVLFSPRRWLVPVLWSMIAVSAGLRFFLSTQHVAVFYLTFTRLDGLAAGSLLAVMYSRDVLKSSPLWPLAVGILAAMTVAIGMVFRNADSPWFVTAKYILVTGLFTALLAWVLSGANSPLNRFLRERWLRFIGRVSYGLYVYHPAVFAFVIARSSGVPALAVSAIAIVVAFLVAIVSWYGFERYFVKLKDRFAPEVRATPHAPLTV